MPMYDYHCEANGRTVEVVHGMSTRFETWGELCAYARLERGDTPAERRCGAWSAAAVNPGHAVKQSKAWGEQSKSITMARWRRRCGPRRARRVGACGRAQVRRRVAPPSTARRS